MLALMKLGLPTLQTQEIKNYDDLTPIKPRGYSSRSHLCKTLLLCARVRNLTTAQTWGYVSRDLCPLKSNAVLQLQMSSLTLARLHHLEAGRKQPWQSNKTPGHGTSGWRFQLPSGVSAAIFLWVTVSSCNTVRQAETLTVRLLED